MSENNIIFSRIKIEALEVAIEMGGRPATISSRFALKVLEYYNK